MVYLLTVSVRMCVLFNSKLDLTLLMFLVSLISQFFCK